MKTLTDGNPIPDDYSHTELKDNGQQKGYVVLSEEDRTKGFIRELRFEYKHLTCGSITRMSQAIAETYAIEPKFYSGTFCIGCKKHFPLSEFVWKDTEEVVGS